jgi:hypothetical protein
LIRFSLQVHDSRPMRLAVFKPVPDLFTGKLCPKSGPLADPAQPARERLRINNC